MSEEDPRRRRLLGLLRRHGWNATSFQAIEPEFQYWFESDGDAAVAYLDTGGAWVAAGAPIASIDRCDDVAADGCTFVTLGLAPLAGSAAWLRHTRTLLRGFYNFEGLRAFKAKLRPDEWTPIYLAWPDERPAAMAVYDVLNAFAGGRLVRFALRAIATAPSPVLYALGVLLVPWTAMLAFAETKRWFGSQEEQLAWVGFDVVMAAALFSLARRWRRPVAAAACFAALADGVLTAVSATRRGVQRRWPDAMVVAAAIAAPFAAAAILAGGLRRRRSS